MAEASTTRPPRRNVRFPLCLKIGEEEVDGFTNNVSTGGFSACIAKEALEEAGNLQLQVGTVCSVGFYPRGNQPPIRADAEVVWLDRNDRDIGGRPTIGLGARLLDPSAETIVTLLTLANDSRYLVLVVGKEPHEIESLHVVLDAVYDVVECDSSAKALDVLEHQEVAVLITDETDSGAGGLSFLKEMNQRWPDSHVRRVVLSGSRQADNLQAYINEGKIDHYMTKPYQRSELLAAVGRAVDGYAKATETDWVHAEIERSKRHLEIENAALRKEVTSSDGYNPIIGQSSAMQEILNTVRRVAVTSASVLIRGETGTGKELIARALHTRSRRREKPFISVNCAALPEGLIESELFGHERGAFTGATARRAGRFERAHGGTLLIDEIGDLPLAVQVKLLRVLQEKSFERLGGTSTLEVDVRIIAATHRDLELLVQQGKFREDLYYRLDVVPLYVPSLRSRPEDVWPIAVHYLKHFQRQMNKEAIVISARMRRSLETHSWPGNVRELINVIERVVALADSGETVDWSEVLVRAPRREWGGQSTVPQQGPLKKLVGEFERRVVSAALERAKGNQSRAAKDLEITRQTLAFKIKKYGIEAQAI